MNRLYDIGDVVYVMCVNSIAPVIITDVELIDGSFEYNIDYNKFEKVVQDARNLGFSESIIPHIKKGTKFYQEDIYKNIDEVSIIAREIVKVMAVIKVLEEEYKGGII